MEDNKTSKESIKILNRRSFIIIFISLFFSLFAILRLFSLQIINSKFYKKKSIENKVSVKIMTDSSLSKLLSYSFPGNVRELKAVMDLAMVLSEDEIGPDNLKLQIKNPFFELGKEDRTMREYQIDILKFYLKKYNDNVLEVSQKLDLGKSTIYRMIKE